MNGYLRSKCRSEQQLLNDLAKLLGARDVASRKMGDVLRELTFFYASAPAARAHLPHTLLSGLCALLPQLKDKKESVLLKEDHLRIARLALCLVARLIDQFELHVQNAPSLTDSSEAGVEKPSVELATSALAGFLTALETAVLTPSGLLLPRQRAILRVYAQLCRVFRKRDQLIAHAAGLLQQSPVLADPPTVDVKGKRSSTAPGPAQVAAVAGACHALRFHVESDEQIVALDKLVQAAFMIPAGTASRHASSTLLALFASSSPADEDRPPHAVAVAKALERFLLKARPSSLRSGDSLTSVYLLRLCGLLHRLPVHQQQSVPLASEGAGSDLDSKLLTASDPLEAQVQSAAIQGVVVSNALAAMLQEYLMDVIQASVADGASSRPVVAPAVLLTAVEEALRGSDTQTSFLKRPNWGNMCLFELVAAALLSLLPSQRDAAKAAGHAVVLHRVCRAVQFVAERLDTAVLQLNASSGQSTPSPTYLSHLALRVRSLTKHSNAFVACEALRAFVWLLPRGDAGSQDAEDDWPALMTQLETLPLDHIQPERRAAIAWTLFRRGVTTPKTHGYAVDTTLLAGCLRVVLAWFRARPCVWHAALLTAVWHTALRDCLAPLGDAVFASINEVLDYQCAPSDPAAADSLVVKQSALQFLSQREGGVRYAVQRQVWSRPLLLRLTKQALLETCTSQRLSVRALSQLHQEAERQGSSPLTEQLAATLHFLQRTPGQPGQTDRASSGAFENRALATPASDFSNWGESKSVEMPQQVVAADEDPFSDFRAPADATVSFVTEETVAKEYADIVAAEDPFADFREAERTASAGFTGWGDFDTAKKQTEVAETKDETFSAFGAPGDSTASSAFAAWGDDDPTHKPGEASGDPFTDFRATDSTAAAGFTNWPDEGLAEKQQTAADTADQPSSDLGAAGAASEFPSWGDDVAVETQEEPGDSGEVFMEVKASGDSEAPERAGVDDTAANFDEKDAAFSTFSAPSADSAFADWGDSAAVEKQDEPSEAVPFANCAVGDDSTASAFTDSIDGDTKEMQQPTPPATDEAFADFKASEDTAASGFTNWDFDAAVGDTQGKNTAAMDNRDRPESAFASWADGDTTEMQPAVSDSHDLSASDLEAREAGSSSHSWTGGDVARKQETPSNALDDPSFDFDARGAETEDFFSNASPSDTAEETSDLDARSELVFDAGAFESPAEAALSSRTNSDTTAKSEAADQSQGDTASEQRTASDAHDEIHAEFQDKMAPNPSSWTESDAIMAAFDIQGSAPDVGVPVSESVIPLDSDAAEELDAAQGVEMESGSITSDAKSEQHEATVGDSLQGHAVSDIEACVTVSVPDAFDSWAHDTASGNENAVVLEEESFLVCSDNSAVVAHDKNFGSEEPDSTRESTGVANIGEPNQASLKSHNETIADVDVPEAELESATLRMASGDTMTELNAALDVQNDSFSDFEPRNAEMEAPFPLNSVAHSSAQSEGFGDFDAFDSGVAGVGAMEQLQASVDAQDKVCDDAEAQNDTESGSTFARDEAPPDVQDTLFVDLESNKVSPQSVSINWPNDDATEPVIRFPNEVTKTNHADFDVPASYCADPEALQAEPPFNLPTSASDEALEKESAAFDEQDEAAVDEQEFGTGSVLATRANDDTLEQKEGALDSHGHEREAVLDASLGDSRRDPINRTLDDATGTEAAYHEVESERLAAFEVPNNDTGGNGVDSVDSVDSGVEHQQRTDLDVEMEPFSVFEARSAEEELNFNGEVSEDEVAKEAIVSGTPDEVLDGGEMPGSSQVFVFSSANADTIEEEQAPPGAPEDPVADLEACGAKAGSGFAGVVSTEALNLLDDAVEDQNELLCGGVEGEEGRELRVVDSTNDGSDSTELRDHEAETLPEAEASRRELELPSTYRVNDYQRETSVVAQDEICQHQTEAASASTPWTNDGTVMREKDDCDVENDLVAEPDTSGVVQGFVDTRDANIEAGKANHIDANEQEEFDEIFLDAGAVEPGHAVFTANIDDDTVAQENSACDDQKDLGADAESRGVEAACAFSDSITESTIEEEQARLDALNKHVAELSACGDAGESAIACEIKEEEEEVEKEDEAIEEGDATLDTRPSCTSMTTNERREMEHVGLDAEGEMASDLNARETETATAFSSRTNDDMSEQTHAAGGVRQDEFDELFADPDEQGGGSVSTSTSQVEGESTEQETAVVGTQESILAGSEASRTALESAGGVVTDGMDDDFFTAIVAQATVHSGVAGPDAHDTLPTSFDDHDEFDEIFADPEECVADPTSASSTRTDGDTVGGEQVVFDDEGDVFADSEDFATASAAPNHAAFHSEDDFDEIFKDPGVGEHSAVPASAIPSSSNDEATEMEDIDLDVSTSDAHGAEAESILIDGDTIDKKHGALDTEDPTVSETEIRGGSPTCS